ncbi:hypothetical protein ANN_21453, partial [Periplaneta americana]
SVTIPKEYGRDPPDVRSIKGWYEKFKETDSVDDKTRSGRLAVNGDKYINCKDLVSINALATCDSKEYFENEFPSLHYGVRVDLHCVLSFILNCFILHNIAKYLEDDDFNYFSDSGGSDSDNDGNGDVDYGNAGAVSERGQRMEG